MTKEDLVQYKVMHDIEIKKKVDLKNIYKLQSFMSQLPDAIHEYPLKHSFADKLYIREIRVPAGHLVVTKMFKQEHATFLLSGDVSIITTDGREDISSPNYWVTSSGVKRAILCHTDVFWVTVHSNPEDSRDIDEIEKFVIDGSTDKNLLEELKEEELCLGWQ